MKDDTLEFVVWQYDYDRNGVHGVRYFAEDSSEAQAYFAVRSGLLDERCFFSKQELNIMCNAVRTTICTIMELSGDEENAIYSVIEHIEELTPPLSAEAESVIAFQKNESSEKEELEP